MILPIVKYPSPVLSFKSEPVPEEKLGSRYIKDLARNLEETCISEQGLGISAVQCGILLQVMLVSEEGKNFIHMVNPVIHSYSSNRNIQVEGCLSLPEKQVAIDRPESIRISWYDIYGQDHIMTIGGLFARCCQHEMDHLNGILMTDYE